MSDSPIDPRAGAFVVGIADLIDAKFSNIEDYQTAKRWAEVAYNAGRRGGVVGSWATRDPLMPNIIASDAVPPDTMFVIAPSPVDDPRHPDYVPIEQRAVKIRLDPEEQR